MRERAPNLETIAVEPCERKAKLRGVLQKFPQSAQLLERGGYMAKLELLAAGNPPFFYFDSDIIWLKQFSLENMPKHGTVFSTETWSWYYGIAKPHRWIKERIPARVNSGFAWMWEPFPWDRMETMLAEGCYNPDHRYSTDQELLAFLYKQAQLFDLTQFARSRVGALYHLNQQECVALHFPGRMWM